MAASVMDLTAVVGMAAMDLTALGMVAMDLTAVVGMAATPTK